MNWVPSAWAEVAGKSVGRAAILHNGVIDQKVNECVYNCALCNLALGGFVFYENNNKDCFL